MDLCERGASGAFRHPWETARFKFVRQLIEKHCTRDNPLIVDVGSGDGFFLESLQKTMASGEFVGVDIALSDEEVAQLNSAASGKVHFSNRWEDARQFIRRPANVILLLDVIEHIEDDYGFVRSLVRESFVSADTIVIITVPAFWSLRTAHDDYLKHFRRYSLSHARQTVRAAGFTIINDGYFFFSLLIPRIAEKLREIVLSPKRQVGIGAWQKGVVVTKALEGALLADASFGQALSRVGIRVPGLSLYLICRRS
jgi:2-polyprenyl-3-methyl-5-hydroxy-6-metoxy-1,4-benzoquinol methylase